MDENHHLTPELLTALAEGRVPQAEALRFGWRHLLDLCPTCRQAFATFQASRSRSSRTDYDAAFAHLREKLAEVESPPKEFVPVPRDRDPVERDLAVLVGLPAGKRLPRVERATKRFRGAGLAKRLLAEARSRLPGEPHESLDLVRTARAVLYRCRDFHQAPELWVRILAYLGNGLRTAEGDLRRAESHLREARRFLHAFEVADPMVHAELDRLEASLCRDQRRFTQAESLCRRAAGVYLRLGEEVMMARCHIQLATLHSDQADPTRAIEEAGKALGLLDPAVEPRLAWCAAHSRGMYLCDAGRPAEARAALEAARPLYDRFPDAWTQLRRRWLEGKIAAGLAQAEAAEQAFVAVREGFLGEGQWYDAALASLELAAIYADAGRVADSRAMARELVPLFEAHDIHREALAAFILVRHSA